MITLFLFVLCLSVCLISCGASSQIITYNEPVRNADSLVIHEGILSPKSQLIIKYIKNGKKQAIIQLSAPVCVAQAENEEPWGFYQFPSIGKAEDGTLIVTWQMQADSHESYGKVPERQYIPMISKDGGHSWNPQ